MLYITLNTGQTRTISDEEISTDALNFNRRFYQPTHPGHMKFQTSQEHFLVLVEKLPGAILFAVAEDENPHEVLTEIPSFAQGIALQNPLIVGMVCWYPEMADESWQAIEKLYFKTYKDSKALDNNAYVDQPEITPWLAVANLYGLQLDPKRSKWVGEFAKGLGWTFYKLGSSGL